MIVIKKGIELPISGAVADDSIHQLPTQALYAVIGDDYLGLRPTMMIAVGDKVREGQALFEDKKNPGVLICSPVSGEIVDIVRGERRRLLAVTIRPDESLEPIRFTQFDEDALAEISAEQVREQLQKSGAWSLLRQRPFDKTPKIDATPQAIFVNTMDSNPLAVNPMLAFADREADYQAGLTVLSKLTAGPVHVVHEPKTKLPQTLARHVQYHAIDGIHPAGLVGTHIHFIDPVSANKTAWHLNLQDLLAIGHLFRTGYLDNERIISIAGPGVINPQFVKTRIGVSLTHVLKDNLAEGEQRIISGSIFAGRQTDAETAFLGFYDKQVVVLPEGRESIFLEFMRPGMNSYSRTRAYLGRFLKKPLPFTTSMQGSPRPIVPFGIYDEVMPLDILPTLLLKALIIKDTDTAVQLGALELAEEDVALLTYVDPGKHDFGAILRENLEQIEEEG